jgi:SAM-dependent methyltransferase
MNTTSLERKDQAVTFPEVMNAVSSLQCAAEALAVVSALASTSDTDTIPAPIAAAFEEVLSAAGVPDLSYLPPAQRAMVGAYIRSAFGQARDLLERPSREVGWSYTDPAVLEGQGRASMMMPTLLTQTGHFGEITSFLDVGAGVGWLSVGAAQLWPNCAVVGIDTWEPSLQRARSNVAEAGLTERIELRLQDATELPDVDRFDLTWVPSFFIAQETLPLVFDRVLNATRPGGQIAVARYNPPADPLAAATLRLRTIRDGGCWTSDDEVSSLLARAGWADVRVLPPPAPTLTFIAARKA